ncbi:ImmA/IrrE family metallo-endopeptidase [Terasakiella sp. SH-1]|uniref:ImmA/IrrE family metallo-endopeptidase n=1 Tax=Terasakiella sp. SH-1 TaxID=2560057 RepID=UPI001073E052|nr:ImmA/IrrE family metallo-endopeptidase [Terasakiella sp. SH-1]
MTEFIAPSSSKLSKKETLNLAAQVAERLGYTPGESLLPIIEELGGEIIYVSDGTINETQDGSIVIDEDGKFKIFLADDVGRNRQRFTIAHELGHLVLHYILNEEKQAMKAHRYGSGPVEWEANWFAAGFLMPENAFTKTYHECEGYLTEMSEKLGVSYKAAEIRADQLGLDVW